MATPNERLAASLEALHAVQRDGIVRSSDLSRTHRTRLIQSGFLEEVLNGWLIVTHPGMADGASTAWYSSFWAFVAQYLGSRFGGDYCLAGGVVASAPRRGGPNPPAGGGHRARRSQSDHSVSF